MSPMQSCRATHIIYVMNSAAVQALLPHLPLIVTLGEVEHVTLAAAMLGMPQPTVSRTIRRLEAQLGTKLVEPEGRGVRLTAEARLLVPYAQRALDAVRDGVESVESAGRRARATVRLAFQTSLGEYLVPQLIRAVRDRDPAIRFVLSQGARSTCLDMLDNHAADLALVSRMNPPPGHLVVEQLFEEPLIVLVPADHPRALRTSMTVHDLAGESLITFKNGYGLRGSVDEIFARAGVLPKITFEGEDLHTVYGLVAAGLGVSIVPPLRIPEGCVGLSLDDPHAFRDISAALLPDTRAAAIDTVLTALRSLAARTRGQESDAGAPTEAAPHPLPGPG